MLTKNGGGDRKRRLSRVHCICTMHCVQCTLEKQCTANHVISPHLGQCSVTHAWGSFPLPCWIKSSDMVPLSLLFIEFKTVLSLFTLWRHQMETFFALLAICAGNSPVPVNSPHKGQWRGALMFSLICAQINGWVNNGGAGDFNRHRAHYDVIVIK